MLSSSLLKQGFHNSHADSSLFILAQGKDLVYVLVYVDDILITGNNPLLVSSITKGLGSQGSWYSSLFSGHRSDFSF